MSDEDRKQRKDSRKVSEESELIRLQQEREISEKGSPAGGGRVVPRKMTLDEIERRWR